MAGRVLDLLDHFRVDAVEQPAENRFAGLPNDSDNHNRYEQADDGAGERIAQPAADSAAQDGEAGQAVDARVVAVGDERGAADFFADSDAKDGDRLVARESDDRSDDDGPQVLHRLGMEKAINGLVDGDGRAR